MNPGDPARRPVSASIALSPGTPTPRWNAGTAFPRWRISGEIASASATPACLRNAGTASPETACLRGHRLVSATLKRRPERWPISADIGPSPECQGEVSGAAVMSKHAPLIRVSCRGSGRLSRENSEKSGVISLGLDSDPCNCIGKYPGRAVDGLLPVPCSLTIDGPFPPGPGPPRRAGIFSLAIPRGTVTVPVPAVEAVIGPSTSGTIVPPWLPRSSSMPPL